MAKPPGIIDKINFVIDVLSNTCANNPFFYLETAIAPAGNLILNFLSFGLDDVIRGFFRPKGLRSSRHGRKGRRDGRRTPGIPEIGEEVAKLLPGREEARGRAVTDGVKKLWLLDTKLQAGLFWWFVFDQIADFLYEWATNIALFQRCDPNDPIFQKTSLSTHTIGGPTFALPVTVDEVLQVKGYGVGSDFGAFTGDHDSVIMLAAEFTRNASPGLCRIRLTISDNGFNSRWGQSEWQLSFPGQSHSMIAKGFAPKEKPVGWVIQREQISGNCNGQLTFTRAIMNPLRA